MNALASSLAAAACALLLVATPALADDASGGVEPPRLGFVPDDLVSVRERQVHLDRRDAHVRVTLAGTGAGPTPHRLGRVATPSFKWRGDGDPYPTRQYPELAVRLDGRTVGLHDSVHAETPQGDITATLRAAHVDPFVIADSPPVVDTDKLAAAQAQALRDAGALKPDPQADDLAMWSARRDAWFDLPARARAVLDVSYLARPAFALQPTQDGALDPTLRKVCTSTAALRQRAGDVFAGEQVLVEDYVFDVAAADAHGAPVALDLRGGIASTVFAACGANGASLVGTGRLAGSGVVAEDGRVHVVALSLPQAAGQR